MTVTSGVVTISKDSGNLIGISIGGGAPLCPCLYIVQVREVDVFSCFLEHFLYPKTPKRFIDIVDLYLTYWRLNSLKVFDNTPAAIIINIDIIIIRTVDQR